MAVGQKRPSKQVFPDHVMEQIRVVTKEVRARMGWSQETLGRALGHHQTTVSRMENDGGCTHEVFDRLKQIANGLGIPLQSEPSRGAVDGAIALEPDDYPGRSAAITAARLIGLSDVAISQIKQRNLQHGMPDRSALAWFQDLWLLHTIGLEGPRSVSKKRK